MRSLPRLRFVAFLSLALVAAACSDRSSSLTGVRSTVNDHTAQHTLHEQITAMIPALWPPSANTASGLLSMWSGVERKVANNDPRARAALLDVVTLIQARTPRIVPPPGETRDQAAAHLVLLMSTYVYGGPATPPPEITPESEATLALVTPTEEKKVQTPSHDAGVTFPPGSVSQPTIIVVTRNEQEFPEECSGPLPTTRCQYPEFYKFDAFPDVRLNTPALIAVCHVNAGDHRLPRADHERFRLAHQKPADPAAYHPEGIIEGDIEILPLVSTGALVDCEDTEAHEHAVIPPSAGLLQRLAIHAGYKARKAGKALAKAIGPKNLYAIDRGGGGAVFMFSDFAVIDPASEADVYVAGYFSANGESSVVRGRELAVQVYDIANDGTGPAAARTDKIVLATNASLSEGVIELATVAQGVQHPGVQQFVSQSVTIPEATTPGDYFIGVKLDAGSSVPESDEENNTTSVPIRVNDTYTLFCPEGPPGAYGNLQDAVNAAPIGGTVAICNGLHSVENVSVSKSLTIRSQNPGGATLRGITLGGGQGGTPIIRVTGMTVGTVNIHDITFSVRLGARGVVTDGDWHNVNITDSRFMDGDAEGGGIGVMTSPPTVPGQRLEITNGEFNRLSIGVFAVYGEVNVRESYFSNMLGGSMIYSGSTGVGGYGTTENNEFVNCATSGCIRILANSGAAGTGQVRILNNDIGGGVNNPSGVVTLGAITITRASTVPLLGVLVDGNEIESERTESPADQPLGYEWADGILVSEPVGGGVHEIRNNRIRGVFRGLNVGAQINARDNRIEDSWWGIFQNAVRTTSINRNDFTGVTRWFQAQSGSNFQCNWWGTTDAPPTGAVNPATVNPAVYNPRASGPIANTTNSCVLTPGDPTSTTHLFSFNNGGSGDIGGSIGTLLGGATTLGGKLQLNGEAAYVQQDRRLVAPAGSFSVSFFARQSFPQTSFVEVISQGLSGTGFYLGHDPSRQVRVSDAWPATGRFVPTDGLEHHYAMTYDEATNTARLYMDGIETTSRFGTLARGSVGGSNTRFGRQFDPYTEFFAGELDNLAVHNQALTATDVARLASRNPDLACSAEGTIVSGGGQPSTVVFENRSGEAVRVEWLNFTGNRVLYATLPNGASYPQGTFVTHPWIITGVSSGRCYGIWQPVSSGRIVTILPPIG